MTKLSLAVFNTQPPHLYLGGVERRILETAKHLAASEVDVKVYSATKAGFHQTTTVEGATIIPCNSTDKNFPLDNYTFNRTLAKMAKSIDADVYEVHAVSGYGFQRALNKRGLRKAVVHTVHGVLADEYIQAKRRGNMSARGNVANFFMHRLGQNEKESAQNATLIVTISNYSKQKIVEHYGVNPEKIRLVPNGVDPKRFNPNGALSKTLCSYKTNKGRPTVLFVGRLIPRKGLTYLIQAAQQIVKEHKTVLFAIAGDGPLKSSLNMQVQKLGLEENFAFLGDVSEEELAGVYRGADVFVLPSIQEGQGIALLEAQASGKPVVAFNVSGIAEAVRNNETGLLVEAADSEALAEAVSKLLSDTALREKMGAMGRRFVEKELTWTVCAQKMLQVYREAQGMV
ncbi:MAG: glycosyltransferase family 4 protein [Candidatus Bathyarchaeota archaeon]|nr:glycosyltransferase family 4 protein [Candidatus Bathyarchaeota archaeon]